MSETLTQWGNTLTREIENHVTSQKQLLDKWFNNQKQFLDIKRKEFLADFTVQEKKKDYEQISRLLDECKALKFDLARLHGYKKQIQFMDLMTEEQVEQRKQDGSSACATEHNQSENKPTKDDDNSTDSSTSASKNSPPKPTSESAQQTRTIETQTSIELDHSTNGDDNLKSDVKIEDDTTNRCPVCFMIFSQSMTKQDRLLHVNEHYTD